MVFFDEINGRSIYTDEFYYDEIEGNSTDTDIDEPDSNQVDETFLDEIEGNSTDTDIDEPDSDQTDEVDNPIYISLCELNFVFIWWWVIESFLMDFLLFNLNK